jgi:hypothetical protein
MLCQKILESLSFRLREWLRPWVVDEAWIRNLGQRLLFLGLLGHVSPVFRRIIQGSINLPEIYGKLSIEIDPRCDLIGAETMSIVHILSLRDNFVIFIPIFFNEIYSIYIEYGHENVLVLLEKFCPF